MKSITNLIEDRKEAKRQLKWIETNLTEEINNLPEEVLKAIALEVVKPNFPLARHMLIGLKERFNIA